MHETKVNTIEKLHDLLSIQKEPTPFSQNYNFVLQNLIDQDALSIWVYLQSLPNDWKVNLKHLHNHFPRMGVNKIKKALSILKACGLYLPTAVKENGMIVNWVIIIKCGIGCEQLINDWKEAYIFQHLPKKKRKVQSSENQTSGENHMSENQTPGAMVEIHAQQGVIHKSDFSPGGELNHIQKKERSLQKKKTTTTNKQAVVVETLENFKTPDSQLRRAFRANPFVTAKIKSEEDFILACEFSLSHRDSGITETQRLRGILKLVALGAFEEPKGWIKCSPEDKQRIEERMRLQEEESKRKYMEEQRIWNESNQKRNSPKKAIDLLPFDKPKLLERQLLLNKI